MSALFEARERATEAGDHLHRWYSPTWLAVAVCARLHQRTTFAHVRHILEPSCGGGAFVAAARAQWPDAIVTAIDIDSAAHGLTLAHESMVGDALVVAPEKFSDLVVGNPPFGSRKNGDVSTWSVAAPHVDRARRCAEVVAFVLPLPLLCSVEAQDVVRECSDVWPVIGRPFGNAREMGVFVWGPIWQRRSFDALSGSRVRT